jgi:hypothetical protein
MTKRRPKTECSVEDGVTVEYRHSASIHVVDREITEDTCLALWEQLFEMQAAPNDIAKLLASKLRETPPDPRLLNMLALMLDPKIDSHFKLVIKRQRDGKTWTRRANDAALAKFTNKYWQALGGKRGQLKDAIAATAAGFRISEATVRKALREFKMIRD